MVCLTMAMYTLVAFIHQVNQNIFILKKNSINKFIFSHNSQNSNRDLNLHSLLTVTTEECDNFVLLNINSQKEKREPRAHYF